MLSRLVCRQSGSIAGTGSANVCTPEAALRPHGLCPAEAGAEVCDGGAARAPPHAAALSAALQHRS